MSQNEEKSEEDKQLGTTVSSRVSVGLGLNSEPCASSELYPEYLLLCTPFLNVLFMSFFSIFLVWVHFFFHERSVQNKITKARGKRPFWLTSQ